MKQQFEQGKTEEMADEREDGNRKKKKCPDMLDLLFYFEQTGVGLPRDEMVLLNLSIRKLASEVPVENIRYSTRAAYAAGIRDVAHTEIVLHRSSFRFLYFSDLNSCATQVLGQGSRKTQKLLRSGGGTPGGRVSPKIRGKILVSNLQRMSKFHCVSFLCL